MNEHVHGCLGCRPDMVPDFDRDDPRYHDGVKCGFGAACGDDIRIDGQRFVGYTKGWFEGREGWVLVVSEERKTDQVCVCPCDAHNVCLTPRFGVVTVGSA